MFSWAVLSLVFIKPYVAFRTRHSRSDSCSTIGCGASYNWSFSCQCNDACSHYKNCCSDYDAVCKGGGAGTCASYGCMGDYKPSRPCQCNYACERYKNCCPDFQSKCKSPTPTPTPPTGPSPSPIPTPTPPPPYPPYNPSPSPGSEAYWAGVNTKSLVHLQGRLKTGYRKIGYNGLWTQYKTVWVGLPDLCSSKIFDVYSDKCWTKGTDQCGTYRREGDCYNREHSWPKSWWGGGKGESYTDMFHVMPSDGYVNGRRSAHPFGEVPNPSYTSSQGHKVGTCGVPGYNGTCFEPIDNIKGLMARSHLYMTVRYHGELSGSNAAVNGADMKAWYLAMMLKWNAKFPVTAWEAELNNRVQRSQGNRNPFIDFPDLAATLFG